MKLLNIVDEYTRECPAIVVDRSIDADKVVATLDRLALERGAPAFVRFDNGPEFIAARRRRLVPLQRRRHVFIDPGSPWQNAWIESFNGRLRDEFLNGWHFDSLLEAQVLIEDWRIDYNSTDPTAPTATSPPASSPRPGPPNTNQHSHSRWTTQRGPLGAGGSWARRRGRW